MIEPIKPIILGLVQAITEFLPVSSSGHLRIAEYFLGFKTENILSFEIALHVGTFLATCLIFRHDILIAIKGFFSGLKDFKNASENDEGFRIAFMVIIASIPIAITGFFLEKYLSDMPMHRIGLNLIITGSILLLTKNTDKIPIKKDIFSATYYNVFIIGVAQALAVFPGISRSGMTISVALFLGLNRDFAGRFSFLISLPAIFGALILSLKNLGDFKNFDIVYAVIGLITSFVFGIIALKFLMSFLKRGKFFHFGFYCMIVGIAVYLYFTTVAVN